MCYWKQFKLYWYELFRLTSIASSSTAVGRDNRKHGMYRMPLYDASITQKSRCAVGTNSTDRTQSCTERTSNRLQSASAAPSWPWQLVQSVQTLHWLHQLPHGHDGAELADCLPSVRGAFSTGLRSISAKYWFRLVYDVKRFINDCLKSEVIPQLQGPMGSTDLRFCSHQPDITSPRTQGRCYARSACLASSFCWYQFILLGDRGNRM